MKYVLLGLLMIIGMGMVSGCDLYTSKARYVDPSYNQQRDFGPRYYQPWQYYGNGNYYGNNNCF